MKIDFLVQSETQRIVIHSLDLDLSNIRLHVDSRVVEPVKFELVKANQTAVIEFSEPVPINAGPDKRRCLCLSVSHECDAR